MPYKRKVPAKCEGVRGLIDSFCDIDRKSPTSISRLLGEAFRVAARSDTMQLRFIAGLDDCPPVRLRTSIGINNLLHLLMKVFILPGGAHNPKKGHRE